MLGGQMSGVKCRPPYIILSSFLLQWTMTFIPWKLSIIHAIDLNSKLYSNVYIGKLDPWHPPFMKSLKYGIQLWITPVPRYSKFTFDTPAARSVLKFRGGEGACRHTKQNVPGFWQNGHGLIDGKDEPPHPFISYSHEILQNHNSSLKDSENHWTLLPSKVKTLLDDPLIGNRILPIY